MQERVIPTTDEIRQACEAQGLTRAAIDLVTEIADRPPVRRVRPSRRSTVWRVPSRLMGRVIQAESAHTELAAILRWEWDPTVLAYFDQPHTMQLKYSDHRGRNRGHRHTPDFLLVTTERTAFIECKPVAELLRLQAKSADRYNQDPNGEWRSPAGERAARDLGLSYQVWVPGDDQVFIRNTQYLAPYFRSNPTAEQYTAIDQLVDRLTRDKILRLSTAIDEFGEAVVHYAIVEQRVYYCLDTNLLTQPDRGWLYADPMYADIARFTVPPASSQRPSTIRLQRGHHVDWDGETWHVINVGRKNYTLQDTTGELAELPRPVCRELVQAKRLTHARAALPDPPERVELVRQQARPADMEVAIERMKALEAFWAGESWPKEKYSTRSLRRWGQMYETGERAGNGGFIGLLPRTAQRGNRAARLSSREDEVLRQSLDEDYQHKNALSLRTAYVRYRTRCADAAVRPISYEAYRERVKALDQRRTMTARSGPKAAYQMGPEQLRGEDLSAHIPDHGDYPWARVHMDHTRLPINLRSGLTGDTLGTPWLSMAIDGYSRVPLAHVLTYMSPGNQTLMLLMRDCVRRNNQLPVSVVVDGGAEFQSIWIETFLARYRIKKIERARSSPRHGSIVESAFGSVEKELVCQMGGNTQGDQWDRARSATHSSAANAIWTPDDLDAILQRYLYEVMPHDRHSGLHDTPKRLYEGARNPTAGANDTYVPYDEEFYVHTLLEPPRQRRTIRQGQVRVQHLTYRAAGISLHDYEGQSVEVRYDPEDPTFIYIFVSGEWHECITVDPIFRGIRESGIQHTAFEIQGRAALTNRSYRQPSALRVRLTREIVQTESDLRQRPTTDGAEEPGCAGSNASAPATEVDSNTPEDGVVSRSTMTTRQRKR